MQNAGIRSLIHKRWIALGFDRDKATRLAAMSASFATGRVLTDKSDRPDSLSSLTTVDLIYYSPRYGAKWSSTVNVRKICDVVRRFI
jgi:hypothetical protein